jgi:hypothetical protein
VLRRRIAGLGGFILDKWPGQIFRSAGLSSTETMESIPAGRFTNITLFRLITKSL